jgi:hypothetical protein
MHLMEVATSVDRPTLQQGDEGEDVRQLQRLLQLLGDYEERIDGDFGPATEEAVRAYQDRNDLQVDGIVGPETWSKLSEAMLDGEEPLESLRHAWRERDAAETDLESSDTAPLPDASDSTESESAGTDDARTDLVIGRAEEEWNRPVTEPNGEGWERIDEYIRGSQGLAWTWEERYVRNRQFAWCGAFAAFCFEAAGLNAEIRQKVMPSTYRLKRWATGSSRLLSPDAVGRGDVVIVGPAGGNAWGSHITICESAGSDGYINTFEGNASGTGPDGSRYEGVVRQRRPFERVAPTARTYRIMYGIRFLPEDFD